MVKKNIFQEYQRNEEMEREKQEIANRYNLNKENVVVSKNKASKLELFLVVFKNLLSKLTKVSIYLIIFILVTIGATVLMNESLRMEIINMFIQNI